MTDDDLDLSTGLSDLRSLNALTKSLNKASESFGKSITNAFARGIVEGRRFEDVLRNVGKAMTQSLLKTALSPLQTGLSSLLTGSVKGLSGLFGGGGASLPVAPFADGGVIASPSYFPMARGLGLMGEAGPEAIMPLSRGPDGKLGIRGGGDARRPLAVTVQVSTPDADSFRRSGSRAGLAAGRSA